jgi:hypothetical protein
VWAAEAHYDEWSFSMIGTEKLGGLAKEEIFLYFLNVEVNHLLAATG